jgi:excisionase family DNA binding protein
MGGNTMTKTPNPESLVGLRTAEAETEVSISTLRRWIREGKLPAVRVAGSSLLRVKRGDLQSLFVPK